MKVHITGANGQLGKALTKLYPNAETTDHEQLDITDRAAVLAYEWTKGGTVLNAAAYTNVDGAETPDGRVAAWNVNAQAVANLAEAARNNNLTLVHISSDYVFDGTQEPHDEDEPFSPLSTYGASKAAGDITAALTPSHYIIRTSWVIGEGKNFVKTMLGLAEKGISPTVVADQIGRPTFTQDLAAGIKHLLDSKAGFGTYNLTNSGDPVSWAELTREIFKISGHTELAVTDVTTKEYFAGKAGIAPRPLKSMLNLSKIEAIGFKAAKWRDSLVDYIAKEKS